MSLFRYEEKRYGKTTLVLFSVFVLALSVAGVFGGVFAVLHMSHWVKYVIVSVAGVVSLALAIWGLTMIIIAFSMTGNSKSVRDVNASKGTAYDRLCDQCGRVITKNAQFCEHCGAKQHSGLGLRSCPNCKTKNSAGAAFCEKCGYEFKD